MLELMKKPAGWLAFTLIPLLGVISFIYFYLLPKTPLIFGIAMPIAVGFSTISGAFFFYFLNKNAESKKKAFWANLGIFLGLSLVLVLVYPYGQDHLDTCPVCGYKTLSREGVVCPICGVALRAANVQKEGYDSMDELIRAESIIYWMPAGKDPSVNFFAPRPEVTKYEKDTAWHPRVTLQEILEVYNLNKP